MMVARALLMLFIVTASPSAAVTFDVTASPVFEDIAQQTTDLGGSITGFFTVSDMNGDQIVDAVDVTEWSFTGTGFTDPALNVTLSSTAGDAGVVSVTTGAVQIGAGLSAGVLDFFQDGMFLGVQIDFVFGPAVDFFNLNESATVLTTQTFTVTPQPTSAVPLPAPLLPLFVSIGLIAVVKRFHFA
ncbi:MAG: hypothetical protein AAF968_14595 [Pseudomonadota bacterium]